MGKSTALAPPVQRTAPTLADFVAGLTDQQLIDLVALAGAAGAKFRGDVLAEASADLLNRMDADRMESEPIVRPPDRR